jgi:hypothetical protein
MEMRIDETTPELEDSGTLRSIRIAPEISEWVSTIASSAAREDGAPLSLRAAPLQNWTNLRNGETTTLSNPRDTRNVLAEVLAGVAAMEAPVLVPRAQSRRGIWIAAILIAAALIAFALWAGWK